MDIFLVWYWVCRSRSRLFGESSSYLFIERLVLTSFITFNQKSSGRSEEKSSRISYLRKWLLRDLMHTVCLLNSNMHFVFNEFCHFTFLEFENICTLVTFNKMQSKPKILLKIAGMSCLFMIFSSLSGKIMT